MKGLHTWVINLDKDRDRLQRIATQLDAAGLPWTRQSAVYGRDLSPQQRQQSLDVPGYRRRHGMEPVLGELGCYLSHLAVARALLASPYECALVLEDDALLTPALRPVLQGLLDHPTRWDMVKLSQVHSGTPQPYLELAPGHWLAVMLSRCTGSSAYLMNRHAAQRYADGLLPMQLPYDHVFDQGWRFGLKVRMVTPTPCIHDQDIATSITHEVAGTPDAAPAPPAPSRKFPWHRRLPTFAYRLKNELARVRYGLLETWRERRLNRARATG